MTRRRHVQDETAPRVRTLPGEALPAPPEWYERAACASAGNPDAWFAEPGQADVRKYAVRICRGCDVRDQCLADGLDELWGTWGGATERQRLRMRNPRGAA